MSRKGFRSAGVKGAFLGPMGRPSILLSHAPGWRDRKMARLLGSKKSARVARTLARMRAAGQMEED